VKVSTVRSAPGTRLWAIWVDRFAGSDPGLNRFRMALQTVLTIAVILAAESLFVHLTHALQIRAHGPRLSAAKAAEVAVANHEFLVIALLLGAIIGMLSSFGVMDQTARGQLVSTLFLPVPMVAALALGIAVGSHRILALASYAVILAAGTYGRRFGPRGFIAGMLLFMGDFFGFFLHGAVRLDDLGWLAAEIGVGVAVAIAVRFALFYPRQAKALERTQRSYAARARKVAALALELFGDPGHTARDVRRLSRQLVRLNEAALMIDAQLGDPGAVADGSSAELLHQRLFDVELALTNIARFAQAMARFGLPAAQHSEVRLALLDVVRGDNEGARGHAARLTGLLRGPRPVPAPADGAVVVVQHRFAGSVIALADAMGEWMALGATDEGKGAFQPSVQLFGGWLPGSADVSIAASLEPGTRRGDRAGLAHYTRTAVQIGIAVGAATALGDLLSGRRFYWAVLAAFVTFLGANNSGEQVRKAFLRVAGTLVGIGAGSMLVTAVGGDTFWSIAVILAALFFGFYLMRINYAFMVVGITVMVSQLYVQLGEFSNSMLLLRLEETAIGAAVAIVVVMVVLPLRTRRVLRVALRAHVQAVGRLAGHAGHHLLGEEHGTESTLRSDARAVDAAYQAVVTTAQPLRRNLSGSLDEDTGRVMRLASAARHYSRNLVADTEMAGLLDAGIRLDIEVASATLHQSVDLVAGALAGPRDVTYTRSSALFDRAERRLEGGAGTVGWASMAGPAQLAVRDLKLVDGTMAQLAEGLGLGITDYDTDCFTGPDRPGRSAGVSVRGRVRAPDGAGVGSVLTLIEPMGRPVARAHLAGRVTAAGGRLVPGAHVTLLDATGAAVAVAEADEAGRYAFDELAGGEYTALASGYPPVASALRVTGQAGTVRHDVQFRDVAG
jgi:uncharacterized membrane protein YgaE (UPF0421/DUF939 family)